MLGKYDSERDSILHALCISDWANESFGDVSTYGAYVWRIELEAADVATNNGEFNSLLESLDIVAEFRNQLIGNFLVIENDQGLVSVIAYDEWFELDQVFQRIKAEYEEWDGQDDDSDDDATGDDGYYG